MATSVTPKYNVGGVALDRPFKIRRLGHFGFNAVGPRGQQTFLFRPARVFYHRAGGRRFLRPGTQAIITPSPCSTRKSSTSVNSPVRMPSISGRKTTSTRSPGRSRALPRWRRRANIFAIWGSRSCARAEREEEVPISSLCLGAGRTDLRALLRHRADKLERLRPPGADAPRYSESRPTEPQLPDYELVRADIEKGINVLDGYRWVSAMPLKYSVDGLLLPQPFKITRVGPVNFFVDDYETCNALAPGSRGFHADGRSRWQGERCAFLRCDNEHHSLGLFPKSWRKKLGLSETTSNMSFGLQLANYQQLKDAVTFLRENGVRVETDIIPPELASRVSTMPPTPSTPTATASSSTTTWSRSAGTASPRPKELRRKVDPNNWPEILEPLSDTYSGEPFIGPWA